MLAAANPVATSLGLHPGMAVAQALAISPGLQVVDAEPDADAAALEQLARWCHRFTPLTAVDAPGLWLDVTGCAHLWGGEAAMLHSLADRLARSRLHARIAVADTPGAAHALARYGGNTPTIVLPGAHTQAIASLPVCALRIPPDLAAALRRLGFDQISQLSRVPRTSLARRVGSLPGLRLDQANGSVAEPIRPLAPECPLQRRVLFPEPLLTAESLAAATIHLVAPLCQDMERMGLGARQIDLLFERVDGQVAATRIGTARPSHDVRHLSRLLNERLDTVDPGLGVEAMLLVVPLAQPLQWKQQECGASMQDVSRLIDQLARLGPDRLYQATPSQNRMPDQAVRHTEPEVGSDQSWLQTPQTPLPKAGQSTHRAQTSAVSRPATQKPCLSLVVSRPGHVPAIETTGSPLHLVETRPTLSLEEDPPLLVWRQPRSRTAAASVEALWPSRLHVPSRLLNPPCPIEAIAALPDHPPLAFTWRRRRHQVRRADGPERIHDAWWQHGHALRTIRDYYLVEDKNGQRFWLFRQGNGQDLRTGDLSWFLHGLF